MSAQSLFVPGRLCLFGEHSDWAGRYRALNPETLPGHCIAVGTSQGIYARVAGNDGSMIVDSHTVNGAVGSFRCSMQANDLRQAAQSGSFYAYCAGVAAHMVETFRVGGITIQTTAMDLPLKKGLSSSAAACVLTARAYNRIYHLNLNVRSEMECAYQGEIQTGSECGRMDQVCAYGQTPVFLTFDGDGMDVDTLRPRHAIHMVVVDLKRGKDTKLILHDLNAAFNADSAVGAGVRNALGTKNEQILFQARAAVHAGNAQVVGNLMDEAQSIFDCQVAPACPGELTAPKLHEVLQHPLVLELTWGGKGVGSQGDGCAQLVARDASAQQMLVSRLPQLLDVHCFELDIAGNGEPDHEP